MPTNIDDNTTLKRVGLVIGLLVAVAMALILIATSVSSLS